MSFQNKLRGLEEVYDSFLADKTLKVLKHTVKERLLNTKSQTPRSYGGKCIQLDTGTTVGSTKLDTLRSRQLDSAATLFVRSFNDFVNQVAPEALIRSSLTLTPLLSLPPHLVNSKPMIWQRSLVIYLGCYVWHSVSTRQG